MALRTREDSKRWPLLSETTGCSGACPLIAQNIAAHHVLQPRTRQDENVLYSYEYSVLYMLLLYMYSLVYSTTKD